MYERGASNTDLELAMLNAGGAAVDLYSGEAGGYSPTFMLVATYEEIPPDPSAVTTNEVWGMHPASVSMGGVWGGGCRGMGVGGGG